MAATMDLRGRLHQSWGWLLALGVVLILFGGLILTTPLGVITATLTTEIWIAAALVAAGVLQLAHGLKAEGWSARSWQMLGGIAFIIGGLLIFVDPTFGLVSITMIVAATLVAQGITSLLVSGGVPDWGGRKWLILSAVVSIVAGLLVAIRSFILRRLDPRHHRRRSPPVAGHQPDAARARRAPRRRGVRAAAALVSDHFGAWTTAFRQAELSG